MSEEHPMQPVILDDDGVPRFKANGIVRFLLDAGPYDLNKLALMPWTREDREQLAQLIGYSVSGFSELSYARENTIAKADAAVIKLTKGKP